MARPGRIAGVENYSTGDLDALLEYIGEAPPNGASEWENVPRLYEGYAADNGRADRELVSLKNRAGKTRVPSTCVLDSTWAQSTTASSESSERRASCGDECPVNSISVDRLACCSISWLGMQVSPLKIVLPTLKLASLYVLQQQGQAHRALVVLVVHRNVGGSE
ncbi:unnamed protein product [Phytophthora fragariaefolia]|uniref:Unnamed protein product n=1 Tax=Phytophthora fragariaefolia TaxID=1490495 RepID=A0A9W6X8I3_9STRA|nr:unnamed protein product [Phytophthora fragariaefolia]